MCRCSAGPRCSEDRGLLLKILPSAPTESLTEPSNKVSSLSPASLEMQSCEKVGEADTAGQISWCSLPERMQGPIPAQIARSHQRQPPTPCCRISPLKLQFPGGAGPAGADGGLSTNHCRGFGHRALPRGKGSCFTDTAMPDIA